MTWRRLVRDSGGWQVPAMVDLARVPRAAHEHYCPAREDRSPTADHVWTHTGECPVAYVADCPVHRTAAA